MNATLEAYLDIYRKVVEVNNLKFKEIVQNVFDGLNQRYDQMFKLEFRGDGIAEMERHDVMVLADVFYAPDSNNSKKIGNIDAPSAPCRGYCSLVFRFCGSADDVAQDKNRVFRYFIRKKTDKFLQELGQRLASTEMPNARYQLDPLFTNQ